MHIKTIPISELNPAAYNPRKDLKPGDPEYEKLKKSISEFGFVEPIVWNQRTGNVVGGHQRLKVLRDLGEKEVTVSVVDLNEKQEAALNVALNKISGDWDIPKLKDLLVELDDGDFDLALTGFDEAELKKMIDFDPPQATEQDLDAVKVLSFVVTNGEGQEIEASLSRFKGSVSDQVDWRGAALVALCRHIQSGADGPPPSHRKSRSKKSKPDETPPGLIPPPDNPLQPDLKAEPDHDSSGALHAGN